MVILYYFFYNIWCKTTGNSLLFFIIFDVKPMVILYNIWCKTNGNSLLFFIIFDVKPMVILYYFL